VNTVKVQQLLDRWDTLLEMGEQTAKTKASKNADGLEGRIRRTTGTPVIFDFDTYENQKYIQNSLCQKLPQYANLIRSTPEIMNGHAWIRNDFIELYFGHFRLVVEKLRRLIGQTTDV
jgi:hypothetical protein